MVGSRLVCWAWCIGLSLLVLMETPAAAEPPVILVDEGEARARIFVSEPTLDPADFDRPSFDEGEAETVARSVAVADLVYHLRQMSGATLEVVHVDSAAEVEAPAIVLGRLAVDMGAQPTRTTDSQEGFRLLVRDGLVLIGGQSDAAVRHGTYELLRRLGCDWIMPGEVGEVIPQRATVTVQAMDLATAPDFQFRRLWYRGYPKPRRKDEAQRFQRWLWRHQAGDWRPAVFTVRGHAWPWLIREHKAVFDKNPEMYALVRNDTGNLVRQGPQLESTHPKVVELYVQHIQERYREKIAAGEWTSDTPAGFPIGPADGGGYSLSAESLQASAGRVDPVVGELNRTDELILLANRILEQVTPAYPNAHVGFYLYSTHADYPARYEPHTNIVVIFAPINFSRFHSVLSPNAKTQAYQREVVERWGSLHHDQGNPLWFRGYNWNLADNLLPYTKVKIWGEELPFYHKHGSIGLDVEATKQWGVLAPSDYVFMRMAWDTSRDWRTLLRDFCEAAFGPAANPMERYQLRLIERQHDAGMEAGSYHAYPLIYDAAWVEESQALFDEALTLAETGKQRTRISYFRVGLDALAEYLHMHDTATSFDFDAAEAHYQRLMELWQEAYDANTDIVANEAPAYLRRFIESFVEQANQYSRAPYRLIEPLPDEMKTMFDPNVAGQRMSYHQPAINDSHFIQTRTYGSTWDAQGLAGIRSGAVWYRWRFTLPDDLHGEPVGLFIGGAEDEARVWINGQEVGTSGRAFSRPFVFDLTDDINASGENLLAIQVVRNSKLNEIGLGGLIRPSFLFTGPRLETKAPRPMNVGRVLPGGEIE